MELLFKTNLNVAFLNLTGKVAQTIVNAMDSDPNFEIKKVKMQEGGHRIKYTYIGADDAYIGISAIGLKIYFDKGFIVYKF